MNNDWDPLTDYISHKEIIKSYDSINTKISETVIGLTKLSDNNNEINKSIDNLNEEYKKKCSETTKEIDKLVSSIKLLVNLQHGLRDKIEKLEENHGSLNNKIGLLFDNQKQFFELLQKEEDAQTQTPGALPFMSNYASLRTRNYFIRQNKPFKFVPEHADKEKLVAPLTIKEDTKKV